MNSLTDQQLLRDYAETRSEAAFAELVLRHVDLVYSAATRMVRDVHLAEDVTQNVFVAFARDARELADRPVLSGWLHRTTQNIAAQMVRTDVRRRAREQESVAMNELLFAETEATWQQIAPQLDIALGELVDTDRDAVMLRYFERKSAAEIAQILNISDEAAQKRVSRAVERLREFLAKRGITVGTSALAVAITTNAVQAAPVGLTAVITTAALALAGPIALGTATTGQTVATNVALQAARIGSGASVLASFIASMTRAKLQTAFIVAASLLLIATLSLHLYNRSQELALHPTGATEDSVAKPLSQSLSPRPRTQRIRPAVAVSEGSVETDPVWVDLRKILYSKVNEGMWPSSDLRAAIDRLKSNTNDVINVLWEAFQQGQEGNALPAKRALGGLGHMKQSAAGALPVLWEFLQDFGQAGGAQAGLRDMALMYTLPQICPEPELVPQLMEYFRSNAIVRIGNSDNRPTLGTIPHESGTMETMRSNEQSPSRTILRDPGMLQSLHSGLREVVMSNRKLAAEMNSTLVSYLSDPEVDIRLLAAGALVNVPGADKSAAVRELIACLNDAKKVDRHISALIFLQEFGSAASPAVPSIEQIVAATSNENLRQIGAQILARIRQAEKTNTLQSSAEPGAKSDATAFADLIKSGRASIADYASGLTNKDQNIRVNSARALGAKKGKAVEALPALYAALQTDDEIFRDLLGLVIKNIDPNSAKPILTSNDITPAVRAVADHLEATSSPDRDAVMKDIDTQMRKLSFNHKEIADMANRLGAINNQLRIVYVEKILKFDPKLAYIFDAGK